MIIKDPNGPYAGVNSRNEQKVNAVALTQDRRENEIDGSVWSYSFVAVNPAGAGDNFIFIENTNGDDYVITDIRAFCETTIGYISVNLVTGTPAYVGATAIAPVGRNSRYTQGPNLTVNYDANITNITSLGTEFFLPLDAVLKENHLKTTAGIILGPNGKLALQWSAATGEISGTISMAKVATL